jgi:hypothetical protein
MKKCRIIIIVGTKDVDEVSVIIEGLCYNPDDLLKAFMHPKYYYYVKNVEIL